MRIQGIFRRFLILACALFLVPHNCITTSKKSDAVLKYCDKHYSTSLSLVADHYKQNQKVNRITSQMFPVPGDQLIDQFLTDGYSGFYRVMKKYPTVAGLNYGILIGGLILGVLLGPLLMTCCVCPSSCPPCRCHEENKEYSTCQLCWPNICIIFFGLVVLGLSTYILVESRNFNKVYNEFRCSTSVVTNDLLYGVSDETGFFAGLVTISDQVQLMADHISEYQEQFRTLSRENKKVSNFLQSAGNLQKTIALIPDGVNGSIMELEYPAPFLSISANYTVPSLFPGILGTADDNISLIGKWRNKAEEFASPVETVANQSEIFMETAADILRATQPSQNMSAMQEMVNQVTNVDFKIKKTFQILDSGVKKAALIGSYVIIGLTIFFTLALLCGSCGLLCYKYSCRNLIYFACSCLWVLMIAHFVLALFFSYSTPLIYYGCRYITDGFDDPALFKENLGHVFQASNIGSLISTCLTPNNGDAFLKQFLDPEVATPILAAKQIMDTLNNFSPQALLKQFNASLNVANAVKQYQTARVLDFDKSEQLSELIKISTASRYPDCQAAGFTQDSWLPSVSQSPVYVKCQVQGNKASQSNCSNYELLSRSGSCNGCMDSFDIMSGYGNKQDVQRTMESRYPNCTSFSTDFSNLWGNFYQIKNIRIGEVKDRADSAEAQSAALMKNLNQTIAPLFRNQLKILSEGFPTVLDPKEGVIAGFDCSIIRRDIDVAMKIFCVNTLNSSFYLRLFFGIMGFSILFLLCCGVCSGRRHYLQDKLEDISGKYLPKNKKIEEDADLLEKQLSEKRFMRYF